MWDKRWAWQSNTLLSVYVTVRYEYSLTDREESQRVYLNRIPLAAVLVHFTPTKAIHLLSWLGAWSCDKYVTRGSGQEWFPVVGHLQERP